MQLCLADILEPLSAHLSAETFASLFLAHNRGINACLLANADAAFAKEPCVTHLKKGEYRSDTLVYKLVGPSGRKLNVLCPPVFRRRSSWNSMDYYTAWRSFTARIEYGPFLFVLTYVENGSSTYFTHCTELYKFRLQKDRQYCMCWYCQYPLRPRLTEIATELISPLPALRIL